MENLEKDLDNAVAATANQEKKVTANQEKKVTANQEKKATKKATAKTEEKKATTNQEKKATTNQEKKVTANQEKKATANQEKKATKKVAEKKETEKKMDLDSLSSTISSISIKKGNGGIYKDSLFQGMNLQEKRKLRTKLRATLDKFISNAFQFSKDSTKLEAIRKDWKKYANNIYKDVNYIYDGSNELKESDIKRFLAQMEK